MSDAVRLGTGSTINPGLRFDHSRAISQDVPEFDVLVHETGRIIEGRGTVDTWNVCVAAVRRRHQSRCRSAERCCEPMPGDSVRALLTGEISAIHPGRTRNTITRYPSGDKLVRDPSQVTLDPETPAPVHRSVFRLAWIAKSVDGSWCRLPTFARTAATSSGGRSRGRVSRRARR